MHVYMSRANNMGIIVTFPIRMDSKGDTNEKRITDNCQISSNTVAHREKLSKTTRGYYGSCSEEKRKETPVEKGE